MRGYGGWYDDFFDLSTDRQVGMSAGPIPHASIIRHTECWPETEARLFYECMRALDGIYLNPPKPVEVTDPKAAFERMFG